MTLFHDQILLNALSMYKKITSTLGRKFLFAKKEALNSRDKKGTIKDELLVYFVCDNSMCFGEILLKGTLLFIVTVSSFI